MGPIGPIRRNPRKASITSTSTSTSTSEEQGVATCGRGSSWLAFAFILILAAALRFPRIGLLELWLDENYSVVMALWPRGVLAGALSDTNPPLYLYLLKFWMALFGTSAGAVRALSAVLGVAQLAVMGPWLVRLGLPRRAALWAMAVGALAPLHVYYSQEARSYTLAWLLLTLALWALTEAVASKKKLVPWALHALGLVLLLYTHNLFVFFVPVLWAGAWSLGLDRRGWMRLAAAHAAAGFLYAPWLALTLRTVRGGSLGWIAENWSAAQAWHLIPGSIEALGAGAALPGIIRLTPVPPGVRLIALAWLAAVLLAALAVLKRRNAIVVPSVLECFLFACAFFNRARARARARNRNRKVHSHSDPVLDNPLNENGSANLSRLPAVSSLPQASAGGLALNEPLREPASAGLLDPASAHFPWHPLFRLVLFLGVLTLFPLTLFLAFSLLASPIYVVARYDTLVFPAFLGLIGLGAWRLHDWLSTRRLSPRLAGALVAFPPMLVALTIFSAKFKPVPTGVNLHPQQARGEILRDYLQPGDMIVCLGLEGTKISYQMLRQGIEAELLTFPLETGRHLGYFLPREVVKRPEQLRADAREIVARFERGGPGRRLWLALDAYSFRPAAPESLEADYTFISNLLLETLAARGLHEWQDPALMARARKLGLRAYEK